MAHSVFLVVYVTVSMLVGLCGRQRRIGFFGFFVLSLLITPAITWLILFLTEEPPSRNESPRPQIPRAE